MSVTFVPFALQLSRVRKTSIAHYVYRIIMCELLCDCWEERVGHSTNGRRLLACVLFAMAVLVVMSAATVAYAENSKSAEQLVQDIEKATQSYQDATATVDNLSAQIAENEAHANEIEAALPAQRTRTAESIKQLYIFQQSSPGLLELLLSADDFNEFITAVQYIDAIHDHNTTETNALQGMYDDLVQTRAFLSVELEAAQQEQDEALRALDTIRTSYSQLQQQESTDALQDAEKIVATLPAPVAEAVSQPVEQPETQPEQAPAQNDNSGQSETTQAPQQTESTPTTTQTQTTQTVTPTPQDTASSDVSSWAARIDAYLSSYGAPLAGHGATFAQAALDYGVDPRLSPAIAVIESGGGKVCFRPYNAWGWGTASWSDWDSAIRGHISGFARLYGSTLTREGAEAYASMDIWETWYNLVLSEMASI